MQNYFTLEGEVINSIDAKKLQNKDFNINIPVDITQLLPNFSELISKPIETIIGNVKNKSELQVLHQIKYNAAQLSIIIKYLTKELQTGEILENQWNLLQKTQMNNILSVAPILGTSIRKHFENINILIERCRICIEQITANKKTLIQYQEMNEALSEELFGEGCQQLATDKAAIAKIEFLISKRIESLILGHPCTDDVPNSPEDDKGVNTDEEYHSDSSQVNNSSSSH